MSGKRVLIGALVLAAAALAAVSAGTPSKSSDQRIARLEHRLAALDRYVAINATLGDVDRRLSANQARIQKAIAAGVRPGIIAAIQTLSIEAPTLCGHLSRSADAIQAEMAELEKEMAALADDPEAADELASLQSQYNALASELARIEEIANEIDEEVKAERIGGGDTSGVNAIDCREAFEMTGGLVRRLSALPVRLEPMSPDATPPAAGSVR